MGPPFHVQHSHVTCLRLASCSLSSGVVAVGRSWSVACSWSVVARRSVGSGRRVVRRLLVSSGGLWLASGLTWLARSLAVSCGLWRVSVRVAGGRSARGSGVSWRRRFPCSSALNVRLLAMALNDSVSVGDSKRHHFPYFAVPTRSV